MEFHGTHQKLSYVHTDTDQRYVPIRLRQQGQSTVEYIALTLLHKSDEYN